MFNTPGFVGCRIVSDGCVGTIRFIGTLPNSEGVWYGVEWDDSDRGKHDGTYNGVRYFFTSAPKSGSFIRLRKIDFGVSLWSAIETRYGEKLSDEVEGSGVALHKIAQKNGATNENRLDHDVYIATNDKLNGTRKRVEVVGLGKLERQRTFQKLTQISLRGASVNLLPFATASEWGGDGDEKRVDSRVNANGPSGGHVLAERGTNRADRCENDIERFERFAALNLTNLRALDLAANLFHSWAQIVRIARALPTLSELVLNENQLDFLRVTNAPPCLAALHESTSGLPSPTLRRSVNNRNDSVMRDFDDEYGTMSLDAVHAAFSHVENVHLKATRARWRDVLRAASYFPNLRELHACANRICASDFKSEMVEMEAESTLGLISGPPSELGSTGSSESGFGSQCSVAIDTESAMGTIDLNAVFGKLEFLCLEDNPISDSAVFDVLSTMQSLRTLVLRRAALGSLRLSPKSDGSQLYFPSLTALNLVGNQLANWRDVDELNKFAALRDLRISENPLLIPSNSAITSTTPIECQFAVARLPSIARLNGVEIDAEERKAAERDYVRFYADDYVTATRQAAADAFHVQHPRFATLLAAFSDLSDRCARAIAPPSASASTSANSSGSNSQLVSVTFRLDMPAPTGALAEVTRSVPRTMTIDKVKALAQRLLRLRVGSVRLSYAHAQASERVHLDNELRSLAYYDVTQNGMVILVAF